MQSKSTKAKNLLYFKKRLSFSYVIYRPKRFCRWEGGSEPKNTSSAVTFDFIHVSTASVGKFSKKCFALLNSIILSNDRPLTTFILSFHPWARLRGLRYCSITQTAGCGRTRRDLVYADLTTCTTYNMICCTRTVADPGEGPSIPPPLFLDQTEARRANKFFFGDQSFPCRNPPSPHYLKVWIYSVALQNTGECP